MIFYRHIKKKIYNETFYPPFCHGGLWIINKNFVNKLYCTAEMTDRQDFHLEDVYITGESLVFIFKRYFYFLLWYKRLSMSI